MVSIVISEKQLSRLAETAMDLDIYVQPIEQPFSNGNEGLESSIKKSVEKLNELLMMFKNGKKIYPEHQNQIHKLLDEIQKIYMVVNSEN